jgi:hypothetical protein
MTWNSNFKQSLKNGQSLAFLFRLEFVNLKFGPSRNYVIDVTNDEIQLENDSVRINGTRVAPQTFNVTFGEFTVNLVGDYHVISQKISRGALAFLYVGFRGYQTHQYQRLIWGQLRNIRKAGYQRFELQFDDALAILNSRLDMRYDTSLAVHKSGLFYTLGQSTTTTHDFTVASDTQLKLTSVTAFEKDSDTNGLILIEESHASDPFYAQWTSKTVTSSPAGYLTMAVTGPFTASYPTTTAAAPSLSTIHAGTKVTFLGLIRGFPPHIMGKVLSRGTGNNLDTLPVAWGVPGGNGDLPGDIYDYADANAQKAYIKAASTTYQWKIPILQAQTEFSRIITEKASALGQFPVLRQGKISWRGVDDPYEATTPNSIKQPVTDITDDDIISVVSHDFFDPNSAAVYSKFKIIYDQDSTTTTITRSSELLSLPAHGNFPDKGDGLTYDPSFTRLNMAVADGSRMEGYYRNTVEKLVLNTHIRMSEFVAGDNVRLTSSLLYGTYDTTTYNRRIGMLSGVDIDFGSRTCTVTILFLPPTNRRK